MPDDQSSARIRGLLREIWIYLEANSGAKDTVEGIQEWWIHDGKQRFSRLDVQSTLEFMMARGWIQRSSIGSSNLYSTSPAAFAEFTQALQEMERNE